MKFLDGLLRKALPITESEVDYACALSICRKDPLPKHRAETLYWERVMTRDDTLRILAALAMFVISFTPPPVGDDEGVEYPFANYTD